MPCRKEPRIPAAVRDQLPAGADAKAVFRPGRAARRCEKGPGRAGSQPVHPLIFFDALRVKIRDEELVRNSATRQCISRSACAPPELGKSSASGANKMRMPNSGCAL
jgi:hypothetical protein